MSNKEFIIYREENGDEWFFDTITCQRVYTVLKGVKRNIDYSKHGITKDMFRKFIDVHKGEPVMCPYRESFKQLPRMTVRPQQKFTRQQPIPQIRRQTSQINQQKPHVYFDEQQPIRPQRINKEGFLSSGVYGANYDEKNRSLTGQSLFSDMMLQNNTTWRTLNERVKETGRASDGPNILGAGPGNEFDGAMRAHLKNVEIFDGLSNEYQTPEKLKEINKNINQDLGSTPTNSVYNRGFQTRAKIVDLGDRAVCAMPEQYMPERDRNRDIFKVHQIIEYPGYDVNIERIGQEWNSTQQTAHTQRTHGRRLQLPSKSKDSLLASQFDGLVPKQFMSSTGLG